MDKKQIVLCFYQTPDKDFDKSFEALENCIDGLLKTYNNPAVIAYNTDLLVRKEKSLCSLLKVLIWMNFIQTFHYLSEMCFNRKNIDYTKSINWIRPEVQRLSQEKRDLHCMICNITEQTGNEVLLNLKMKCEQLSRYSKQKIKHAKKLH